MSKFFGKQKTSEPLTGIEPMTSRIYWLGAQTNWATGRLAVSVGHILGSDVMWHTYRKAAVSVLLCNTREACDVNESLELMNEILMLGFHSVTFTWTLSKVVPQFIMGTLKSIKVLWKLQWFMHKKFWPMLNQPFWTGFKVAEFSL